MTGRKDYWMSYSSYKLYRECPKHYDYRKLRKVEPPSKDSKHNAIVGSVVQRVYEDFYNEELWRMGDRTSEELLSRVDKYFYAYLDSEYVDFTDIRCRKTQEEFRQDCHDMVPKVLQGIKDHKLLGPYAKSEIALRAHLTKNFYLFGRVDFIIRRPNGEIWLLDGKASKHREKNVDPEQLMFYALAFQILHGIVPDRVGFFFFHFADDPDQAIDWITPDEEQLAEMRTKLTDTFHAIQKRWLRATPSSKACKYCEYANICEERQTQLAEKRAKARWKKIEEGKEVVPETKNDTAFFGFGGRVEED